MVDGEGGGFAQETHTPREDQGRQWLWMTNHRGAINPLPEGATAGELCKGGPNWDILANSFIDSNRIPDFIAEGRGHKSVRAFRGFQLELDLILLLRRLKDAGDNFGQTPSMELVSHSQYTHLVKCNVELGGYHTES